MPVSKKVVTIALLLLTRKYSLRYALNPDSISRLEKLVKCIISTDEHFYLGVIAVKPGTGKEDRN